MKLIQKVNELSLRFNRNEINMVIMNMFSINLTEYYNMLNHNLDIADLQKIDFAFEMHSKCIPLARIFHKRFFWKDSFYVSPFTLDPRPETEYLVHHALQLKPSSVLDIGTGTGCIILSILRDLPNIYGLGIDISKYILETAQYNAEQLNLSVDFTLCDRIQSIQPGFDLIVSNPPYIIGNRYEYGALFDPPIALCDNNFYEQIICGAPINPEGIILLEIPDYSMEYIKNLCIKYSFLYTVLETLGEIFIIKLYR